MKDDGLPSEPEDSGFYITDKNVLIDHCNGAWRAEASNLLM